MIYCTSLLTGWTKIWYWGIGLIVLFPVIILLLNEFGYKLSQRDRELHKPIRTFKNFILPLTALVILLIKVLDFDRGAFSIRILETIIWVLVINAGLAFVNRLFFKGAKSNTWRGNVPQLFLDIFRVFLVLFGGAVVLSQVWNVELGGLVTALGLGSFVLGLALQDTLGNLFSGIALVYEKPFSVGDWIKVGEDFGKVIEMNWRAVRIETREGELIVIPHLMIGQGVIVNFSKPTRVHVIKTLIGFSYQDPPNKVKQALMQTCLSTPGILHEPAPEVKTNEYASSSIVYEVEFAIEDFAFHEEITDELMTRVWYTAQRHHLHIPFPQLTLHQAESKPSVSESHDQLLNNTLKKLPGYLPIQKENVDELKDGAKIQYFAKNEIIITQGDPSGQLYVINDGEIDLIVSGEDGKQVLVNTIGQGDFFGEVALLSSRTNSMSARAKSDVELMVIFPEEVIDMVSRNPKLAFLMDEVMDGRRNAIKKELDT